MSSQAHNLTRRYYLDKEKKIPYPAHIKSNVSVDVKDFKAFKLLLIFGAFILVFSILKWVTFAQQVHSSTKNLRTDSLLNEDIQQT